MLDQNTQFVFTPKLGYPKFPGKIRTPLTQNTPTLHLYSSFKMFVSFLLSRVRTAAPAPLTLPRASAPRACRRCGWRGTGSPCWTARTRSSSRTSRTRSPRRSRHQTATRSSTRVRARTLRTSKHHINLQKPNERTPQILPIFIVYCNHPPLFNALCFYIDTYEGLDL